MAGGRPLKFKTVNEFSQKVEEYFKSCMDDEGNFKRPVTVTGLALYLDTTRDVLCNYQNRDEFTNAVTRAKQRCELYAEEQLYLARSATGPMFALKNFGWSDRQDVNTTHTFTQMDNIMVDGKPLVFNIGGK